MTVVARCEPSHLLYTVEETLNLVSLAVEPWAEGESSLAGDTWRHIGESAAFRCLGADGVGVIGLVGEKDASRRKAGQ